MKSYRFDSASSPAAFCTIWARYLICVLWVKDLWIWSIFIYWQSRGQTVWKKGIQNLLKKCLSYKDNTMNWAGVHSIFGPKYQDSDLRWWEDDFSKNTGDSRASLFIWCIEACSWSLEIEYWDHPLITLSHWNWVLEMLLSCESEYWDCS